MTSQYARVLFRDGKVRVIMGAVVREGRTYLIDRRGNRHAATDVLSYEADGARVSNLDAERRARAEALVAHALRPFGVTA